MRWGCERERERELEGARGRENKQDGDSGKKVGRECGEKHKGGGGNNAAGYWRCFPSSLRHRICQPFLAHPHLDRKRDPFDPEVQTDMDGYCSSLKRVSAVCDLVQGCNWAWGRAVFDL